MFVSKLSLLPLSFARREFPCPDPELVRRIALDTN